MDIKENKLQWSINFLAKNQKELALKMDLIKINNRLMNYVNQLLGNLKKVYSSFKYNIWGADLVDMRLISKYNKVIRYLLCAIDLFSKSALVVPLF